MYREICNFIEGRGELQFEVSGEEASRLTTIGLAAVLWEMAKADGAFRRSEFDEIIFLLDKTLKLDSGEAAGLLEIARVLDASPQRLNDLVHGLIRVYSSDQKNVIFIMGCRVADADGQLHQAELRFQSVLAAKLGIRAGN